MLGLLLYLIFGLNNYNSVAHFYDLASKLVYGDNLYKIQIDVLNQLPIEGKILILGGGTGLILKWLATHRPNLEIIFQDASSSMIKKARSNVSEDQNITFLHSSSFDHQYGADFVFAAFFFDLFTQQESEGIIKSVNQNCNYKPSWVVCDFILDNKTKRAVIRKIQIKLSILFFKITTSHHLNFLPNVFDAFNSTAYEARYSNRIAGGFLCSKVFSPI